MAVNYLFIYYTRFFKLVYLKMLSENITVTYIDIPSHEKLLVAIQQSSYSNIPLISPLGVIRFASGQQSSSFHVILWKISEACILLHQILSFHFWFFCTYRGWRDACLYFRGISIKQFQNFLKIVKIAKILT